MPSRNANGALSSDESPNPLPPGGMRSAGASAALGDVSTRSAHLARYERKLGLAQRLMSALGSEGARWKESIISLDASLEILVGDVLLASAFVSYIGYFNKRFRKLLMDNIFTPYLKGQMPIA